MILRVVCAAWLSAALLASGARAQEPQPSAAQPAAASGDAPAYGAKARVRENQVNPAQPSEAEQEALQDDLGVSFSLAESLPGSLPVFSGVPFLIVRGATPAATATYYDGILLPALFHVALGPSVVDQHLLGKMTFYPGVAPARYGRHTGGAMVAEPPRRMPDRPQRELELTLLDASGYLYEPEARTSAAWRIGNPGLLMNALNIEATLSYYDYQLRHEHDLGGGNALTLVFLGTGDQLGDRTVPEDDIAYHAHRFMARVVHREGASEFGSQLILGYDKSRLGTELSGEGVRMEPSLYFAQRWSGGSLRLGADFIGTHLGLHSGGREPTPEAPRPRSDTFSLDPADFLAGQPYESVPTRSTSGVYGELELEPLAGLTLVLGARADLWLSGSESELALSPNGTVRYELWPAIELHAGLGLTHQAHGSPVPLPSLSDISIDAGLESALQAEVGVGWQIFSDLQLDLTYFRHLYDDMVYLELILDCEGNTDPQSAQELIMGIGGAGSICRGSGLPTADGLTQGIEVLLKRELTERISGFLSYTLSFAEAVAADGTPFTPLSDVRHVANAVLRVDLGAGFALGARVHYRTGKMTPNRLFNASLQRFERVEARLPSFFRADIHASYSWNVSFGRMEASIGVQNVTASSEATKRDCIVDIAGDRSNGRVPILCTVDRQPAIILPNLGIRAEL